ncbi:MAG: type I polyketide synthase [Pseudomonadota bacterium]
MGGIHFIGRACRLPGANTVAELTKVLLDNKCVVTEIPSDRWDQEGMRHPNRGVMGKSYSFAAGVIDDVLGFDPIVFGISPREAAQMDPQQRVLLQVAWEALEDAGIPPHSLKGSNVGVFVGASSFDYGRRLSKDARTTDAYLMTGNTLSLISNRISHAFDLRGPSMTIDTACSSSLIALNQAITALENDEIDTAIVGGVNMLLDPNSFVGFSAAHMLSPSGLCQPFSKNADGYVRAEGAVALVLKKESSGEDLSGYSYGVVVGSDTNADGRTVNVAMPSPMGQIDLLDRIYTANGLDPDDLAFVEAHGTGTMVGDPVEAQALATVLGKKRSSPLPIGSIKSNIGHLEPASGVAGVLKTLIAFEKNTFPASLHAQEPNPDIPFVDWGLELASENLDLEVGKKHKLAGISSFGFGGANSHVVIAAPAAKKDETPKPSRDLRIFFTSAYCKEALRENVTHYQTKLFDEDGNKAGEVFDGSLFNRSMLPHRLAVLCDTLADTNQAFADYSKDNKNENLFFNNTSVIDAKPIFTFSGNGAQYAGMSLAALQADADFRASYERLNKVFKKHAGWCLIEKLSAENLDQELNLVEVAQPLLFADQVTMAEALIARGISPQAAVGHSGGEVAAAYISGAIDLDQAVKLIVVRSEAQKVLFGVGTMAALQTSEEQALAAIEKFDGKSISIAAINSPGSVSVVGQTDEMAEFVTWAKRSERLACVKLKINYPYHSVYQDRIEDDLRAALGDVACKASDIPFISSVTGKVMQGNELTTDYWWHNMRQPVRFSEAISAAYETGFNGFLEIGPQPVLRSYISSSLKEHTGGFGLCHSGSKQDKKEINPVTATYCRALVGGLAVDLEKIANKPSRRVDALSTYPWQNKEFRADDTRSIRREYAINDDFYRPLGPETGEKTRIWQTHVDPHMQPELTDHKVSGKIVVPGAHFIDVALAAAQRATGSKQIELHDMDIVAPLHLADRKLMVLRTRAGSDQKFTISSSADAVQDDWTPHVQGRYHKLTSSEPERIDAPKVTRFPTDNDGALLYDAATLVGLEYGPHFSLVSHFRKTAGDIVEVVLKPSIFAKSDNKTRVLDPLGLDAIFHGLIAGLSDIGFGEDRAGFVPVHISRLFLHLPDQQLASGRVYLRRIGEQSLVADFECFDKNGQLAASLYGVRFRKTVLLRAVDLGRHVYGYERAGIREPSNINRALPRPHEITAITRQILENVHFPIDDESDYLIEATVRRIAYDKLCEIADADGILTSAIRTDPYLNMLLEVIVNADLAYIEDDIWYLKQDINLPETTDLLNAIRYEYPNRISELSLLTQLHFGLDPQADNSGFDPSTFFGRASIQNFYHSSVSNARQLGFAVDSLNNILENIPIETPLKVLEIRADNHSILPKLPKTNFGVAREFYQLDLNQLDESEAEISLLPTQGDDAVVLRSIEALQEFGPFDLIVSYNGLGMNAPARLKLPQIYDVLSTNSLLISIEAQAFDFRRIIFADEVVRDESSENFGQGFDFHQSAEKTKSFFASVGFEAVETEILPSGLSEAALVVAERYLTPPAPISAGSIAKETKDSFEEHLVTTLAGAGIEYSLQADSETNIAELVPHASKEIKDAQNWPLIYYVPTSAAGTDDQDVLSKRMMYFVQKSNLIASNKRSMVVILPKGANHKASKPQPLQSAIWGFMRSFQNENPGIEVKLLDVSDDLHRSAFAKQFVDFLQNPPSESELIFEADGLKALRLVQGLKSSDILTDLLPQENTKAILNHRPGSKLDAMSWQRQTRDRPSDTQVEIAVKSVGLNYRDVMWALNLLPEEALENGFAGPHLGIECSGEIVRVGAKVTKFRPGDKVITFGSECFTTHLIAEEKWVGKLPADVDLQSASTIPVAFFTAYYSIKHLAQLQPDETILIHGGAGGVGLAAIQIAQHMGAKVIATAGSNTKRSMLKLLGVDHILSSRSLTFANQVKKLTENKGVDVVLNSLAGEAMELSLKTLKPFGRFIELGKQDFYTNSLIGARALKDNIAYFGVDVDHLMAEKPKLASALFAEMIALFETGELGPLPYLEQDGGAVVEAFRKMQRSEHIGKILVRPQDVSAVTQAANISQFIPDQDGLHVIVGGLGGLGLEAMEWLARLGAKHIALLSRTAKLEGITRSKITRLRDLGIEVLVEACDISDEVSAKVTFDRLRARYKISGVIHSAMVLDDQPINKLTPEIVKKSLDAKVNGAANLDRISRFDTLDYFVLFSSIATMIGNHGQSAYVAANSYIEALVRNRVASGLPGLAIGWGPITDVGYLAREEDKAKIVNKVTGDVGFTASQALHALEKLLGRVTLDIDPVCYVTPMKWSGSLKTLKTLRAPTYRAISLLAQTEASAGDADGLRDLIMSLPPAKAAERLAAYLRKQISAILRVSENEISLTRPLPDYGMDSLMGVELALTMQDSLGEDLPMFSISDAMDINTISKQIVDHLKSGNQEEVTTSQGELTSLVAKHASKDQISEIWGTKNTAKSETSQ